MSRLRLPVGRCLLQVVDRRKPVLFSTALLLRRLSVGTDSLAPRNLSSAPGSRLRHPVLQRFLANDELGVWSLCTQTVNFIETHIQTFRPNVVLEFGSGISTLCLTTFMRDIYGESDRIYVCSVEQNPQVVESLRQRLHELNLGQYVRFVNAPLQKQRILDREIRCYAIPHGDITEIGKLRPDFIVVDGPAAEAGARFGTLPLVRSAVAPAARVLLDDAFRDGELDAAKSWIRLLGMEVEGVLPTRKGLLIGRWTRRPRD